MFSMKASILIVLLLTGCQMYAGVGVRPNIDNKHLDNMPNPVFRFVAEENITDKQKIYYEHLSAAFESNEDYGINLFGWMYQIK